MSEQDITSELENVSATKEKTTKVKRSRSSEEEMVLEPVSDLLQSEEKTPTVALESSTQGMVTLSKDDLEPSTYLIDSLVQEIVQSPARAAQLIKVLGKITKEWEPIGTNGNPINEVPVPPGRNPKDFVRAATATVHISGYRLTTIFGKEVALVMKDSPKWRVTIEGEYQVDTPFIQHGSKAEFNAKEFAENKLRERGYIIGG